MAEHLYECAVCGVKVTPIDFGAHAAVHPDVDSIDYVPVKPRKKSS